MGNVWIAVVSAALAAALRWAPFPMLLWHIASRAYYLPIMAVGARYGSVAGVSIGVAASLLCASLASLRGADDFIWFSILTPDFVIAGLLGSKVRMSWIQRRQSRVTSDMEPWLDPNRLGQSMDVALDPLASIEGAAGLLADEDTPPNIRRELVNIISAECSHLSVGIVSLLQQGLRRPIPAPCRSDISAIVDSAVSEVQFILCRTGIRVHQEIAPDLPEIECDPDLIRNLLTSLIIRAVQSASASDVVVVNARCDRDGIKLEIRRSGRPTLVDMARTALRRVGSRPRSVSAGLTALYQIVLSHGGKIEARLNLRKGLDFSVWLPLRRNDANARWQGAGGGG